MRTFVGWNNVPFDSYDAFFYLVNVGELVQFVLGFIQFK